MLRRSFLSLVAGIALAGAALLPSGTVMAADPGTVTLDWAYYNPVSLILKDKGWVEEEFGRDGIRVRWVQSQGSNKAIEFLNAKGVDFGSTAGAAALLARINGGPIKSIYVYSKPEWTALVARKDSPITKVEDLKGKRVAVTRGTDPYIFLLRALADHGLTERDIRTVLLQHADGRLALEQGAVDAWAGLDPMMAQTELLEGSRLFYRAPDLNTWGVLNVREDFAAAHPQIVARVLKLYEKARAHALANPAELAATLAKAASLTPEVAGRQLERTDLSHSAIGATQHDTILKAGLALQEAGIIAADVGVKAVTDALIDPSFSASLTAP
ncbi:aliphatic sulfonate ABC transporter substrate-binding protein [Niveispirillum fermenti]|uniref:aliphatic sulfonate ABC transporter substrate-binding protein n=1 Tax=Niveispirillum fermenti TaxID=1233113 RepID=UPI003A846860